MKSTIRSFDLAHLGHVELLTPKPEESLGFFVNVMGMTETARKGDSVYLRGPMAISGTGRRTRSGRRTATTWKSTGRPSGTRRRRT